jgi:hypothetical protein
LWIEGLEFAGEVKLRAELIDDTGASCYEDQVQLKVAPFIMLPNTAPAHRVLVSNLDDGFHTAITALAGAGNVITTTPQDPWPQDAWEFGISSMPYRTMNVAFETIREGRPLEQWGRDNLLGPAGPAPGDPNRTGLIYRQADTDDSLAYGGNLEVSPPLPNYPLGRIVVGTMPEIQKQFLARQQVQAPLIELNTNWLVVGHIDEFVNFASVGATSSWQVVWSDPLWGMNLLSSVPGEEPLFYDAPDTEVFFGAATGGTFNTLIDDTPGVDFTAGPAWQFVRIYDGPGHAKSPRSSTGSRTR